jgi:hypothetical protein
VRIGFLGFLGGRLALPHTAVAALRGRDAASPTRNFHTTMSIVARGGVKRWGAPV